MKINNILLMLSTCVILLSSSVISTFTVYFIREVFLFYTQQIRLKIRKKDSCSFRSWPNFWIRIQFSAMWTLLLIYTYQRILLYGFGSMWISHKTWTHLLSIKRAIVFFMPCMTSWMHFFMRLINPTAWRYTGLFAMSGGTSWEQFHCWASGNNFRYPFLISVTFLQISGKKNNNTVLYCGSATDGLVGNTLR